MDGAPRSSKASEHVPPASPGQVPAAARQPWLLAMFKERVSRPAQDPKPLWHCPQGCTFPGRAHRCMRGSDRHPKPFPQQLRPCTLSARPACCWLSSAGSTTVFLQSARRHCWDPGWLHSCGIRPAWELNVRQGNWRSSGWHSQCDASSEWKQKVPPHWDHW